MIRWDYIAISFFILVIYLSFKFYQFYLINKNMVFDHPVLSKLYQIPPKNIWITRFFFTIVAFIFIILSLLSPFSKKSNIENYNSKGVDILFVVDVSLSMEAMDGGGGLSRLSRVKSAVMHILPKLQGNRLGILAFSGKGYQFCPMTSDISSFHDYFMALGPDMIGDRGSDFPRATKKLKEILDSQKLLRNKLVIFASDGENGEGSGWIIPNSPVISLVVGSDEGSPIPYQNDEGLKGYIANTGDLKMNPLDPDLVITKRNLSILSEISYGSGGELYDITNDLFAVDGIFNFLKNLETNPIPTQFISFEEDQTHWFLVPLLLILMLDRLLPIFALRNKRWI
jgi:Ca-activated chloride channel family protein